MTKQANALRDMSSPELDAALDEERKKLYNLVNELKVNRKLEKPHEIRETRRQVARILTVIREKRGGSKET